MAKTLIVIVLLLKAFLFSPVYATTLSEYPLEPADTTSPRATLKTFIDNTNAAYHMYVEEGYSFENRVRLDAVTIRAMRCLDLSKLPPTRAFSRGREAAALIKEIMDRLTLPPYSSIPDFEEMKALEASGFPQRWRVPHTELIIALVEEGPRQGEYLFTAETVARAKEFYERIKHLPYQPGASAGIYGIVINTPGWMIPHTWVAQWPRWTRITLLEHAIWQWIALFIVLGLGGILVWFTYRWTRRSRRAPEVLWHSGNLQLNVVVMIVIVGLAYVAEEQINLSGIVLDIVSTTLWVAFFTAVGFIIFTIGNGVAEALIASPRLKPRGVDANMIRVISRTVSFLLLFYVIIAGGQFLGIPLTPLLAGLGVGGFAMALAARPMLENFIGGVTLFADKPVRVGDFCRFGDTLGTVEEIGIRSTRIRTWDRTIVSIPNARLVELELENFDRRDHIWLYAVLGLRYETTPEQLRYVLAKLREMFIAHPKIAKDMPLRVRFMSFSDYSLDVEVFTYALTKDWNEFLAIREDVFLRIMDIVAEAGTEFAFPSQTTYLTRDNKLDTEQVKAVEEQVQHWRDQGAFPFPEVPDEHRMQVADTLDYPPMGSPDRPPHPQKSAFKSELRKGSKDSK